MEVITIPEKRNPGNYITILKFIIYIFSYVLFLFLLLSYILSYIYKLILKSCLLGKHIKILPPLDSCWANESISPSNIIFKFKLNKTSDSFYSDFNTKLTRTIKNENFSKLKLIIKEKYGFYVYEEINELNLSNHLIKVENIDIKEFTELLINTRLPSDQPQWRIYFVENNHHDYLLFMFHHCYGDGISWINFLSTLLENKCDYFINPFEGVVIPVNLVKTMLLTPHYFCSQLKNILTEYNEFHGDLVKNKKTIKEFQLDLSDIKKKCKVENVTITKFIENKIKSGFLSTFDTLPSQLLLISPFAKLPYLDFNLKNQFYPCFSLIEFDNKNLNKNINNGNHGNKECNLVINKLIGGLIAPLQKLLANYGARGTMSFSNLPTFKNKSYICTSEILGIHFFPPIKFRTGLSLGLLGAEDKIFGTLGVDQSLIDRGFDIDKFLGCDNNCGGPGRGRFLD